MAALSQLASNCNTSLPYPAVFGAEFTSIQASLVVNYTRFVPAYYNFNHGDIRGDNMTFCNITLTHTHPVGGGGWVAGLSSFTDIGMSGAVAQGYATVTSNGGASPEYPSEGALLSPGNVDYFKLNSFASVSLHDAALAAKSMITSFYGQGPAYSYWSGCSQGGRQGMMFAQRSPDVFDGIAASAPAINWSQFLTADYFPQQVMNELGQFPHPCELDALTVAAIDACDGNDGMIDGIISDPDSCFFDPLTMVGTSTNCASATANITISQAAAVVAEAAWTGARKADGSFLWYTPGYEANLTSSTSLAGTTCSAIGTCTRQDLSLLTDWIKLFIAKDPNFGIANMTRQKYEHVFQAGVREYESMIGTNSPDLSEYRATGGKIIAYHGLADEIIPFRNSRHYYDTVTSLDPDVHDFYRLFEAPGLQHCYRGVGGYPSGTFDALVQWVENGIVPDTLKATSPSNHTTLLRPYRSKHDLKWRVE
ncbi:feruloyl esteras-like protein B precursor [Paraphoma chrysanthemicola]|nr:feruloyl esteras-like protein B precursor [Paraphoma chrysanthemicola]